MDDNYYDDEAQRSALEKATVDFTVKVKINDLIDLVADEAQNKQTVRDVGEVELWSYLGPVAALTALRQHGWFFGENTAGKEWVEAALKLALKENETSRLMYEMYGIRREKMSEPEPVDGGDWVPVVH